VFAAGQPVDQTDCLVADIVVVVVVIAIARKGRPSAE
jgi:hypothetical protein